MKLIPRNTLLRSRALGAAALLAAVGRLLEVKAEKPRYHATEDGRWDFRVTIVFRSAAAAADASGEEEIKKQLFPDQETYRREEQRRFEILLAHWDLPVIAAPEVAP